MNTQVTTTMSFNLITYGLGDSFKKELFNPIKNKFHIKPKGGLWASPVGCQYGWKEWCESNDFGDISSHFETVYTGRTLVIDSLRDMNKIIWQPEKYTLRFPDYEAMLRNGIDAIYLTERGEEETRYDINNLYGYDCECVLVMNPKCIK